MRRLAAVGAACSVAALAGVGCGGSSESGLCTAAGEYRDALAATQAAGKPGVQNAAWVAAARKFGVAANNLLEAAPADIKRDLQPYLQRLRDGDTALRTDATLQGIERRLQDRIETDCGLALDLT